MSLFDSLSGLLTADNVGAIAGALGSDKGKTQSAVSAALPALIAALAANTSSKSGRKSLNKALKKDHDGGILSDLGGFLGSEAGQGAAVAAGGAILGHIFGKKQPAVQQEVAKSSGMDAGDVAKLMATLAPVVMGFLGKKKREEHLTGKQIANELADDRRAIEKRPDVQTGWLGTLDRDGDGNALNDIASMAGGLLTSLGKK